MFDANRLPSYARYRKKELTDPAVGKQLWEITEQMIGDLEKESARRRALEGQNHPATEEEEKKQGEEQLKENLRKKAQEQAAKSRLLDKLIKEEETKIGSLDLPPRVVPPIVEDGEGEGREVPDTPARNTRSRNKTHAIVEETSLTKPDTDTPGSGGRRRTRKT